jgi:hypothetical protein
MTTYATNPADQRTAEEIAAEVAEAKRKHAEAMRKKAGKKVPGPTRVGGPTRLNK